MAMIYEEAYFDVSFESQGIQLNGHFSRQARTVGNANGPFEQIKVRTLN